MEPPRSCGLPRCDLLVAADDPHRVCIYCLGVDHALVAKERQGERDECPGCASFTSQQLDARLARVETLVGWVRSDPGEASAATSTGTPGVPLGKPLMGPPPVPMPKQKRLASATLTPPSAAAAANMSPPQLTSSASPSPHRRYEWGASLADSSESLAYEGQ